MNDGHTQADNATQNAGVIPALAKLQSLAEGMVKVSDSKAVLSREPTARAYAIGCSDAYRSMAEWIAEEVAKATNPPTSG